MFPGTLAPWNKNYAMCSLSVFLFSPGHMDRSACPDSPERRWDQETEFLPLPGWVPTCPCEILHPLSSSSSWLAVQGLVEDSEASGKGWRARWRRLGPDIRVEGHPPNTPYDRDTSEKQLETTCRPNYLPQLIHSTTLVPSPPQSDSQHFLLLPTWVTQGTQRTRMVKPTLFQQKTHTSKIKTNILDSLADLRPALLFL